MSALNKVLEDHQKDQRKFILITQDDMQHTFHANDLLQLFNKIESFSSDLLYYSDQFISLEEVNKNKPTERLFPYIKCPKCNVGHVEEGEDYSYDTHIACCNSSECKQEYWIGYTREYNLETMEEPS